MIVQWNQTDLHSPGLVDDVIQTGIFSLIESLTISTCIVPDTANILKTFWCKVLDRRLNSGKHAN